MFTEGATETEPPQCSYADEQHVSGALMLAAFPPGPDTHAVVIGRRTLDPMLNLMHAGCASVEGHVLAAPAHHLEPASLAWIATVKTPEEMDNAVRQASDCLESAGCMVLDATELPRLTAVASVLSSLMGVGFRLRSVLDQGHHLILVAVRGSQAIPA